MKDSKRTAISALLIVCLAAPVAPARAEMLGAATSDRERIAAVLAREDVRSQLIAQGVDVAQVSGRVAALTDAEAARLAAQIETSPAGGHPLIEAGIDAVPGVSVLGIAIALFAIAAFLHWVKKISG